ncbi:hypothetical protein JAAARDRAFT_74696 [Jaapia argillacea MUCL 33604]|uniref:DUF6534 domain-containing protein n=1 Tax=Jaapia argillacea MUCL 33604 TaxID=933084 RepID=A0A067P3L3_9AGAM|nr:hypothetical protein JAAARDRAFT_74696 [Jaapia argillacea MUCL 33604]
MSFVSTIQSHPVAFLAPGFTSMAIQSFQTGVLVDLSVKFWSRAHRESLAIRFMVAFVSVVAFYQTAATFYVMWQNNVVHYGDWTALLVLTWPDKLQNLVTTSLAFPVQAFLIRRCWMLTKKSWLALVSLTGLLLVTIIANILQTAAMLELYVTPGGSPPHFKLPYIQSFVVGLVSTAVLDAVLTIILLTTLWRSRSSIYSRRFRRTIRRLVLISWEAAVLPSSSATISVLLFIIFGNNNFWYLFFQAILGKLYAISFLITLNARLDQNDDRPPPRLTEIQLTLPPTGIQDIVNSQSSGIIPSNPPISSPPDLPIGKLATTS